MEDARTRFGRLPRNRRADNYVMDNTGETWRHSCLDYSVEGGLVCVESLTIVVQAEFVPSDGQIQTAGE